MFPAGDLEQDLPVGEVRWEDVTRAVNEDRQLAEAEITPAQLYALLEELLSHLSVDLADESLDVEASAFAGFPQVSGFLLTVDASAPVGKGVCGNLGGRDCSGQGRREHLVDDGVHRTPDFWRIWT